MPHVINILFWINTVEMWFCVAVIFSCALPIVQFAPICPNVMMMLFSGAQWWVFPSVCRPDAIFVNMFKNFDFSTNFSHFSNVLPIYLMIIILMLSGLKSYFCIKVNFPPITRTELTLDVLCTQPCCLCFSPVKHYMMKPLSHNQWTRHICRLQTLRGNTYFIDIFHFCWHNEPTINSIPVFVFYRRAYCQ